MEIEEFKNGQRVFEKKFPWVESMVASQGFDNFIRMKFSQLEKAPVEFRFGVLASKDFFTLTGYKKNSEQGKDLEYGIQSSHWFLRIFAKELTVVYDEKERNLKSFKGRSNLLSDSGETQDVEISYSWEKGE